MRREEEKITGTGWVARLGHAMGTNRSHTIECMSGFLACLAMTDRSMMTNKTRSLSGRAKLWNALLFFK